MRRRSFLTWSAALAAGAAAGGGLIRYLVRQPPQLTDISSWAGFTADEIALINGIANVVIPPTQTPGAGDVDVGTRIAEIVTVCFPAREQAALVDGLRDVQSQCLNKHGATFAAMHGEAQLSFIRLLDMEQRLSARLQEVVRRADGMLGERIGGLMGNVVGVSGGPHYFGQLKELIVFTYCKSQRGATEALRYDPVPGHYHGSVPYRRGDRAWAT